ncbi:MAG: hypothetical protein E7290_01140 [Lachnospiraceae bacterium]|nr:hypothetical protein [Lachnospiraceae bacterium]
MISLSSLYIPIYQQCYIYKARTVTYIKKPLRSAQKTFHDKLQNTSSVPIHIIMIFILQYIPNSMKLRCV